MDLEDEMISVAIKESIESNRYKNVCYACSSSEHVLCDPSAYSRAFINNQSMLEIILCMQVQRTDVPY